MPYTPYLPRRPITDRPMTGRIRQAMRKALTDAGYTVQEAQAIVKDAATSVQQAIREGKELLKAERKEARKPKKAVVVASIERGRGR